MSNFVNLTVICIEVKQKGVKAMRHQKNTLARKKVMHKDTFNPKAKSKYAKKKVLQNRGIYLINSPFYAG